MSKRSVVGQAGVLLSLFITCTAHASWWRIWDEHFPSDPSNRWTYAGATNAQGQALMRYDGANQRLRAEWDQGNLFVGSGDPHVITNSLLSAPLGRTLTDRDTFRFGATLQISPGTVPNTMEFYQIANFGLYNLAPEGIGADRNQSDNSSGNATLVRDANNLIEFNYFINNDSFGFNPSAQGVLIARMPTNEANNTSYTITGTRTDPYFHDTDMGVNNYLPADTALFVEVAYHGAATGTIARRVYSAIYTDATRTNLLTVNGVPMFYWTQPAAIDRTFNVDRVAFVNYAGVNFTELFGGSTPNGAGAGSFDDVYVDLDLPDGAIANLRDAPGGVAITWSCVSGATYSVLSAPDPSAAQWSTTAVKQALADFLTVTNFLSAPRAVWGIRREAAP